MALPLAATVPNCSSGTHWLALPLATRTVMLPHELFHLSTPTNTPVACLCSGHLAAAAPVAPAAAAEAVGWTCECTTNAKLNMKGQEYILRPTKQDWGLGNACTYACHVSASASVSSALRLPLSCSKPTSSCSRRITAACSSCLRCPRADKG